MSLDDRIKEQTLKTLGKEQYGLLLLERQAKRRNSFIVTDGLVSDTHTNLIWLRFAYGQTWENNTAMGEATIVEDIVENAEIVIDLFNKQGGYAGFADWRIPSIGELSSLGIEVINSDTFPNSPSNLWSSTRHIEDRFPNESWSRRGGDRPYQLILSGNRRREVFLRNSRGQVKVAYCLRFVRGKQKLVYANSELELFLNKEIQKMKGIEQKKFSTEPTSLRVSDKTEVRYGLSCLPDVLTSKEIKKDEECKEQERKRCLEEAIQRNAEKVRKMAEVKQQQTLHKKKQAVRKNVPIVHVNTGQTVETYLNKEPYINHCWKCHKGINSNNPETQRCSVCRWYKCSCGACKPDCKNSLNL